MSERSCSKLDETLSENKIFIVRKCISTLSQYSIGMPVNHLAKIRKLFQATITFSEFMHRKIEHLRTVKFCIFLIGIFSFHNRHQTFQCTGKFLSKFFLSFPLPNIVHGILTNARHTLRMVFLFRASNSSWRRDVARFSECKGENILRLPDEN